LFATLDLFMTLGLDQFQTSAPRRRCHAMSIEVDAIAVVVD
jgi:hypothetical protein